MTKFDKFRDLTVVGGTLLVVAIVLLWADAHSDETDVFTPVTIFFQIFLVAAIVSLVSLRQSKVAAKWQIIGLTTAMYSCAVIALALFKSNTRGSLFLTGGILLVGFASFALVLYFHGYRNTYGHQPVGDNIPSWEDLEEQSDSNEAGHTDSGLAIFETGDHDPAR